MDVKPTNDLIQIANAGGGLILSSVKPTDDLVKIAGACLRSGAKLTVTNAPVKPTHDLIRIASAGGGNVTFA